MPDCAHAAYARSSLFAIVKSSPVAVSYVHSQTQSQPRRGSRRKCKRSAGVDDLPFRSLRLQHTCGALVTAAAASEPRSPSRRNSSSSTSPPHHRQRAPILLNCVGCFGLRVLFASHTLVSTRTRHRARAAPKRIAVAFLQRRATLGRRDAAHHHRRPRRPRAASSVSCTGSSPRYSTARRTRLECFPPFAQPPTPWPLRSAAALPQHTQWRRPHPGYAFSQVSIPPYTHTQHPVDIAASAADTLPCSPLLHNLQRPPPTLAVSEIHFSSAAKYSPSQSFAGSVRACLTAALFMLTLTPTRRDTQWRKTIS